VQFYDWWSFYKNTPSPEKIFPREHPRPDSEIHEALLDELMKKEYYKYEDIAVPIYKGNQFYFYLVKDKLYRINLSETLGIGRLPDGTFIIGNLKVHPEYQKNMFIYDGEIIDYDAPANIVYGYVGNFINLTIGTLLFTGDVIQVFSNKGAKSDDERDQERIRQGYKKFANQHS